MNETNGNEPIRILHLEDDPLDARLVAETISAEGIPSMIKVVVNRRDFEVAMKDSSFDLIISDFSLPGYSGTQALKFAAAQVPETPFIVVSGTIGEEPAIQSMLDGATDYVLKSRLYRLAPAVKRALKEADERRKRKEAEEELRESRQSYQEMVESINEIIFSTDLSGVISYISPVIEATGGYTSADLIGHRFDDFVPPEERDSLREVFEAVKSGEPVKYDFKVRRKNGELLWVRASCRLHLRAGSPVGISGVLEDLTQRRELERELLHAQKMESIGTLASGIAHDFNNLLGIVLGYATLLERDFGTSQKAAEEIGAIIKAVRRGAGLVRQILTFARKTDALFGPLDVNASVQEVEKLLVETFPKSIEFTASLHDGLPPIHGDATQVNQVLINLCVNARDAMAGGGRLTILSDIARGSELANVSPGSTHDEFVRVRVTDTGTGMDEATVAHIFDPFFTTKEHGKGTGLGLSVVYGVMKEHHGFVSVQSEKGSGTTFQLLFPVLAKTASRTQETSSEAEGPTGGTETILIIEDEDPLAEYLCDVLENAGYRVLTAGDGLQGLELYRNYRDEIDLVLSDLGLPKVEGDTLFREMKKSNLMAPVIIATGFIEAEKRKDLLGEGIADIVQKPYTPSEILRAIRRALDDARKIAPSRRPGESSRGL